MARPESKFKGRLKNKVRVKGPTPCKKLIRKGWATPTFAPLVEPTLLSARVLLRSFRGPPTNKGSPTRRKGINWVHPISNQIIWKVRSIFKVPSGVVRMVRGPRLNAGNETGPGIRYVQIRRREREVACRKRELDQRVHSQSSPQTQCLQYDDLEMKVL